MTGGAVAATAYGGLITLLQVSPNKWQIDGALHFSSGTSQGVSTFTGSITLPGAMDRIRLTTAGGTDAFDAGSVVLMWE